MNRISHVVIVLTPMTISSFTIATLSILSPPSVIPTAMRVTDFFLSALMQGVFLMRWRIGGCYVLQAVRARMEKENRL